jgi:hypothetical protein
MDGLAKQGIDAETFDAQCKVRPKLPPLETPANCKYEVVKPVSIADYYPKPRRTRAKRDRSSSSSRCQAKQAKPTDIRAVSSSMYPHLDEAAVKAVGDMVMSSSCGKARYRLKLSFQLQQ